MQKMQNEIGKWHRETFPNATLEAILNKLHEEIQEASRELLDLKDITHQLLFELADIFIVTCAMCDRYGFSFEQIVKDKMDINRLRKWGKETENGDRPRER